MNVIDIPLINKFASSSVLSQEVKLCFVSTNFSEKLKYIMCKI